MYVQELLQSAYKPFNQVRGLVISDYQNQLEKEWVEVLKERFPIDMNKAQLDYVYKTLIE